LFIAWVEISWHHVTHFVIRSAYPSTAC
jgi:hypothetical protein